MATHLRAGGCYRRVKPTAREASDAACRIKHLVHLLLDTDVDFPLFHRPIIPSSGLKRQQQQL